MAKINDYPNKTFSQLVANLDSFICTNGNDEYNVTIEELFNYHLNTVDHDLSSFITDAEAHTIAQNEAQTIADAAVASYNTSHLANEEHHTTIEITGLADTAANAAISQHLIDASHPSYINDLNDVNTYGVIDGQVLIYDSYTGWTPGNISGGASYLNDLNDVNTYGVINGQVLIYDSYTGWTPGNAPTPALGVLDLNDVSTHIGGPDSGNTLVYDGSYWVTDDLDITQLKNMSTGSPVVGDTIVYNGGIWNYQQAATSISVLNDLSDVTIPHPEAGPIADGDLLSWNTTYNQWVPKRGWTGSFYIQGGQEVIVSNGIIINVTMAS